MYFTASLYLRDCTARRRQEGGRRLGKTRSMSKLGSSVDSGFYCFAFFKFEAN